MRPTSSIGCVLALLLLTAESAHAGSFSVSPTRIELAPGQRTAVITVRNADTAPLTIQAQLVAWTQETGEESYADTRDILATPPVFTIPPNGEQVVRVALRKEPDATLETAYRVFLQEIPGAKSAESNSLNIALRVGVPLFVSPAQQALGKLEWLATPQPDGKLHVEAMNTGTAHVQVTGFEVSLEGHAERIYVNQMKYVLPGTHASWIVDLPDGTTSVPATARVVGSSDRGNFEAPAALAPRL
jgi:fimbrial chaperone protein